MPARNPEQIPQPRKRQSPPAGPRIKSLWASWAPALGLRSVALMSAVWVSLGAILTAHEARAENPNWHDVISFWIFWFPLAALTVARHRARRHRQA
ncbi:hypothetical protein U5640_17865 [Streptomyces sp. SS7]|uniref:hypothetical protein n=1 Tax=Streptomyces sp. SS7 TaxID=3108485 RepID=UPI0030EE527A